MRPAEPGRTALLDAGRALLEQDGVADLSVNAVVARAGLAKGTFYVHFPDRRSYLIALHQQFQDRLERAITVAIEGMPPGEARLHVGVEACLDACLTTRETKALLVEARTTTGLEDEVAARNADFAEIATPSLHAMGWRDPRPVATLFVAMVTEVALAELAAGAVRPDLRQALWQLARPPARASELPA